MVAVFVPFAMGIVVAEHVVLSLWLCLAIACVALWGMLRGEGWWRSLFVTMLFVAAGAALHGTRSIEHAPYHRNELFEVRIEASSQRRGRASYTPAYVVHASSPAIVGRRIVLWSDEHICFECGDRLRANLTLRPFNPQQGDYATLMHHRGYVGAARLYDFGDYRPAMRRPLHARGVRGLRKVLPDDAEETARVFDLLLGDNLQGRKDYIAENGHKYMDMIDVS